jgi:hypothetical protein
MNNSGGILLSDDTGARHHNLIIANLVHDNPFDCGITLASHPPASLTVQRRRSVSFETPSLITNRLAMGCKSREPARESAFSIPYPAHKRMTTW